jgi:hypothetical protein
VKIVYELTKTVSGSRLLIAMLFDVGGLISFCVSSNKACHQERRHSCFSRSDQQKHPYSAAAVEWRSLGLPRCLMEASGMKRLDFLQQKLPLSLHRKEILENLGISVCHILHTRD